MKLHFLIVALLTSLKIFSQSSAESQILNLSSAIFRWEVGNKIDSLADIFHEKFTVVSSTGNIQNKSEYINRLKSGNFVHNNIDVEENIVTLADNSATVIGKGKFTVTVSGQKNTIHLSYMEVFTRATTTGPWKVLAMKANVLDK